MKSLATHSTSCTGYYLSVHTNLQDLIPTLALVRSFVVHNYVAKVGIKFVGLYEQTQIVASAACRVGSQ